MNCTWGANTDGIPVGEMDNNNSIKKKNNKKPKQFQIAMFALMEEYRKP